MKHLFFIPLVLQVVTVVLTAQTFETKPSDPFFEKFQPVKAPQPGGLVLQKGDRLAIIGDSITEQKMYSRIMETYLTVCVPELDITMRQYGWGGSSDALKRVDEAVSKVPGLCSPQQTRTTSKSSSLPALASLDARWPTPTAQ